MVLPCKNPTKSYWIEAAKSDLRTHRSTKELPKEVDVVIIGSGYTGATSAYWLHKYAGEKCPSMLLLEAREICGAATGRNGGQLRPHLYSRYTPWSQRFGPKVAHDIIAHEYAHFGAFSHLFESEGIASEVAFKMGETFDAAMSQEAWDRLKGNYEHMKRDHGENDYIVRSCRLIEDPKEAEAFTQMKGCVGAVVHPAGQVWPYKFVHALLRIVLKTGKLNLQANTPVTSVSDRDAHGFITVHTERGIVKTKRVIHATNRWAGHLLEEFKDLIVAGRGTLSAIKAPEGFIKHTGAQHWDSIINNYHLQLPGPHNAIIVGGAKALTVHDPTTFVMNEQADQQFTGVPEFYKGWPERDIAGWQGKAEFALPRNEGGVWTGVYGTSVDSYPFIGAVPHKPAHFMAAGFTGHGMPRILLSTAWLIPHVLDSLDIPHTTPQAVKGMPEIPAPFHITPQRMQGLKGFDLEKYFRENVAESKASAHKEWCAPWKGIITGQASPTETGHKVGQARL